MYLASSKHERVLAIWDSYANLRCRSTRVSITIKNSPIPWVFRCGYVNMEKYSFAFIKWFSKTHAKLKCHNRVHMLSSKHTYRPMRMPVVAQLSSRLCATSGQTSTCIIFIGVMFPKTNRTVQFDFVFCFVSCPGMVLSMGQKRWKSFH